MHTVIMAVRLQTFDETTFIARAVF